MKWNFACAGVAGIVMLLSACGGGGGDSGNSGNASSTAGTLTFWVAPDWAGDTASDVQLVHVGATTFENHVTVFKNGRYLRFLFADNTGYESGGGYDISDWKKGDRHMITATWGEGVTVLYIDGVSVDAHEYLGTLDLGRDPTVIFGGSGDSEGSSSRISNFQFYSRALSADEVAARFAQPPS